LTQEETIERGLRAAQILESESIMSFFAEQLQDIQTSLFNTVPDDSKERNLLYYRHRGVTEFIQILEAYKTAASNIISALDAEELKEDD
jgi:tRNA C32,U32 (ribose-2'-O)-methylase TrmJ